MCIQITNSWGPDNCAYMHYEQLVTRMKTPNNLQIVVKMYLGL
jgi:hypothetical protein